ncbi:MAG: DmsE family decaheme c-type cytochrome [Steroidobacteraceae bacterium]|jgi:DmsE family decaheme c-type cytochrome|nr:DmsE family decaheme c-type cytochrome [Steroidobacteraceae bacterium]
MSRATHWRLAACALAATVGLGAAFAALAPDATATTAAASDQGTGTSSPATAPAPATPPAAATGAGPGAAYSRRGADTCLGCHDDPAVLGLFETAHATPGDPRSPFGHGQLQCEACHGPGDAHARGRGAARPKLIEFGRDAATPVAEQDAQCLTCHAAATNHWASAAHSRSEVGCADCHSSHAARDPVSLRTGQVEVCGTCHLAQKAADHMPYRHPLPEGSMACTSCHQPHGSATPAELLKAGVTETCTTCHADLRGPFLWEHQPVQEDCTNCHAPHGSANPSILKTRGSFLCQQCHQAAGHPSLANTSDNLPGRGAASVYTVVGNCLNCHSQVHGSNHPSGARLMR